jgi:hypothetical protein
LRIFRLVDDRGDDGAPIIGCDCQFQIRVTKRSSVRPITSAKPVMLLRVLPGVRLSGGEN